MSDDVQVERGKSVAKMLLKVQRALSTNHVDGVGATPALVYNKDRSFTKYVPFEFVAHLFEPGDEKVYCTAELFEGGLQIGDKVAPLKW